MFDNPDGVTAVYALGGSTFLVLFVAGLLWTTVRYLYYVLNRIPKPRLLTRDFIVWGGLSMSFGIISAIRFLPLEERLALTAGNVAFALATTIPAIVAAATYFYFEAFVIRLPKPGDPEAEAPMETA